MKFIFTLLSIFFYSNYLNAQELYFNPDFINEKHFPIVIIEGHIDTIGDNIIYLPKKYIVNTIPNYHSIIIDNKQKSYTPSLIDIKWYSIQEDAYYYLNLNFIIDKKYISKHNLDLVFSFGAKGILAIYIKTEDGLILNNFGIGDKLDYDKNKIFSPELFEDQYYGIKLKNNEIKDIFDKSINYLNIEINKK